MNEAMEFWSTEIFATSWRLLEAGMLANRKAKSCKKRQNHFFPITPSFHYSSTPIGACEP
jgi:hypothetical protein